MRIILKTIFLIATFFTNSIIISENDIPNISNIPNQFTILYDSIKSTIYNPTEDQCDTSPFKTGDGSIINPDSASYHRWIAVSQDLLKDTIREKMLSDTSINRFKGKIQYGDTIWIKSKNPAINGWWVVHDAMNKRFKNRIDFLQTKGDDSLYRNKKPMSDIKIFQLKFGSYKTISNLSSIYNKL